MLSIISWRNVWRNRSRSMILIGSIALGIWGGTFIMAFSWGMSIQYVNIAIQGQISHIQLHNPGFKKDKKVGFTIHGTDEKIKRISSMENVEALVADVSTYN